MNDFYVYAHIAGNGQLFYIGKGRDKRAWSKKGRNIYWRRVVAKHGYRIEIVLGELTEAQAFELEKSLIVTCGRDSLCNLTDGGEGSSGCIPTEQTRKKISVANKGRTPSEEHRKRISESKMGHYVSEETRRKIGAASKGRLKSKEALASMSRPVLCSNGMRFDSVSDATRWLRVNGFPKASKGNVAQRCAGHYSTAYGFCWSYT